MSYRTFFGLSAEPFRADLALEQVLTTPELLGVQQRLDYVLRLGAIMLVTGEVGAGKSTAVRYSCGTLHHSRYKTLWVTASAGSILELYRQLLAELDIATASSSRAVLTRLIRAQIDSLVAGKKQQPLLIIDEASLLRLDVFAELHTITQFNMQRVHIRNIIQPPFGCFLIACRTFVEDQFRHYQIERHSSIFPPLSSQSLPSCNYRVPARPRGQVADYRRFDVKYRLHSFPLVDETTLQTSANVANQPRGFLRRLN
jgi:type II secretory pathway predicted ATPase ExeA